MINIIKIRPKDREIVIDMMRRFYHSPALITNGSEEIFSSNVDNCLKNSPYLEGFVFVAEDKVIGYAMLAKSFQLNLAVSAFG